MPRKLRPNWVETDSYDRAVFRRLLSDTPSLRTLVEKGSVLLPHFEGFVQDLFALTFKMNVVLYPPEEVRPSAGFYRTLLDRILSEAALGALREQTVLDEARAGLAALLLGERLFELVRSEKILGRGEMLDYWNLERQTAELEAREEERESALVVESAAPDAAKRQIQALGERLEREIEQSRRRLGHAARALEERARETISWQGQRIDAQVVRAWQEVAESFEEAEAWSRALGGRPSRSAADRVELGRRLARNPKIRRLSRMIGRMREQARALRRRMYERASEETFEVELGSSLDRLLPAELGLLRHGTFRRDFYRRLVEGRLLEYSIRARGEKGRGPMVVCLDGSSSMAGEKEIWSKAVTLTLLDVARRQRRRFRSICFSSADAPLEVFDLNRGGLYEPDLERILELAEYFPGGGTDFQRPLDAALECIRKEGFRKADVVLITDGECRVDKGWLDSFREAKRRLDFSVFSILIDVGPNSLATVREFSDRIATVRKLTDEDTREIFELL
ncbi:MAG: VWA domain-containing protein [Candidatus Binatia bacterium]|nr:MAG: VWA domain-containing protein [Candidatus Binatia bacterium]